MKLLILGGTRFLGRVLVENALDRGHELTLFNRGRTNADLFPEAEKVRGDRTESLDPLAGNEWDAVVDVPTFIPRVARISVEALRGRVGRYVYISSISPARRPERAAGRGRRCRRARGSRRREHRLPTAR